MRSAVPVRGGCRWLGWSICVRVEWGGCRFVPVCTGGGPGSGPVSARRATSGCSTAHQRLKAPLIVIWDSSNTPVSARMRQLVDARTWLTVVRLPGYAPELNPVEGIWAVLKRGLGNRAFRTLDRLADVVTSRLRSLQRRPDLIANVFAPTGMTLEPELPWPP